MQLFAVDLKSIFTTEMILLHIQQINSIIFMQILASFEVLCFGYKASRRNFNRPRPFFR